MKYEERLRRAAFWSEVAEWLPAVLGIALATVIALWLLSEY